MSENYGLVGDLNTDFMQLLPWGGKITSESLRFFSPIVIWTKFCASEYNYEVLYSAFKDYYKVKKQNFHPRRNLLAS